MRKHPSIKTIEAWCANHRYTITAANIYDAVKLAYGFAGDELGFKSRLAPLPEARQCYTWYCNKLTRTHPTIVGYKINRSRAGVIKLIGACERLLQSGDASVTTRIVNIFETLKQLHEKV